VVKNFISVLRANWFRKFNFSFSASSAATRKHTLVGQNILRGRGQKYTSIIK